MEGKQIRRHHPLPRDEAQESESEIVGGYRAMLGRTVSYRVDKPLMAATVAAFALLLLVVLTGAHRSFSLDVLFSGYSAARVGASLYLIFIYPSIFFCIFPIDRISTYENNSTGNQM